MRKQDGAILGTIAGFIIGVPASYFFQSGAIRAKLSVAAYLEHLPELLKAYPSDIFPPILLTCGIFALAGWLIGTRLATFKS